MPRDTPDDAYRELVEAMIREIETPHQEVTWFLHPADAEMIADYCGTTLDELVDLGYAQRHHKDDV